MNNATKQQRRALRQPCLVFCCFHASLSDRRHTDIASATIIVPSIRCPPHTHIDRHTHRTARGTDQIRGHTDGRTAGEPAANSCGEVASAFLFLLMLVLESAHDDESIAVVVVVVVEVACSSRSEGAVEDEDVCGGFCEADCPRAGADGTLTPYSLQHTRS